MSFSFAIFVVIFAGIYCILVTFFGDWKKGTIRSRKNSLFAGACIASWYFFGLGINLFGTKVPGSLFERLEYDEAFIMVKLFHGTQRNQSLAVPASISCRSRYIYNINFAIMPGGRRIFFPGNQEPLILNERVDQYDDQHRDYGVMLTSQPADKN